MDEIKAFYESELNRLSDQLEHGNETTDTEDATKATKNPIQVDYKKNPFVIIQYVTDKMFDYFNIVKKIASGYVKIEGDDLQKIKVKYDNEWFDAVVLDTRGKIFWRAKRASN